MTDYSKMSDFEINRMLAIKLGNICVTRPYSEISGSAVTYQIRKNIGLNQEGLINSSSVTIRKDFCNNPADAWLIIAENKINIDFRDSLKAGPMARLCRDNGIYAVDKNPLRAAMIAFLMMKGAEK